MNTMKKRVNRNLSVGIPSLFNDLLFNGFENTPTINNKAIHVNIKETEKMFMLELIVPGFKKDDFAINLKDDLLSISAEIEKEDEDSKEGYIRKEYTAMSFKRNFTIPESIDTEKIDANYENGILNITLPKMEHVETNKMKSISIK